MFERQASDEKFPKLLFIFEPERFSYGTWRLFFFAALREPSCRVFGAQVPAKTQSRKEEKA